MEPKYVIKRENRLKMLEEIELFALNKGVDCVEIGLDSYSSVASAYATWRREWKKSPYAGRIRLKRRDYRLYLVK